MNEPHQILVHCHLSMHRPLISEAKVEYFNTKDPSSIRLQLLVGRGYIRGACIYGYFPILGLCAWSNWIPCCRSLNQDRLNHNLLCESAAAAACKFEKSRLSPLNEEQFTYHVQIIPGTKVGDSVNIWQQSLVWMGPPKMILWAGSFKMDDSGDRQYICLVQSKSQRVGLK